MNNDISKIVEILSKDAIFIPKAVLRHDDVYEASKLLFAVIFIDCLKQTVKGGRTAETINKMMKERIGSMTITEIQWECICAESMASVAKSEVLALINHTNIAECLRERKLL